MSGHIRALRMGRAALMLLTLTGVVGPSAQSVTPEETRSFRAAHARAASVLRCLRALRW